MLKESTVHYLDRALSGKCGTEHEIEGVTDFVTHLPCPEEYSQRFFTLPVPELEQKDCFIKKQSREASFHGTTWMNHEVALGSISHECFWAQRHPLIGYWNDADGQVAVLRLRMLKDGRDFSSGGLHNTQVKNKVLTGIKMYIDRGDFHIHLDRPADGIFKIKSLVLRYELTGADAEVCSLGQNQFELSSGKWKAAITAPPGEFNGHPVTWRTGTTQGSAYLEAVLYEGDEFGILFDDSLFTKLVLCTELIRKEELSTKSAPVIHDDHRRFGVTWQGLALTCNPYGENYD